MGNAVQAKKLGLFIIEDGAVRVLTGLLCDDRGRRGQYWWSGW